MRAESSAATEHVRKWVSEARSSSGQRLLYQESVSHSEIITAQRHWLVRNVPKCWTKTMKQKIRQAMFLKRRLTKFQSVRVTRPLCSHVCPKLLWDVGPSVEAGSSWLTWSAAWGDERPSGLCFSNERRVVDVSHCVAHPLPCRDFRSSLKDFQGHRTDTFVCHLHPKNTSHGSGLPPRRKD